MATEGSKKGGPALTQSALSFCTSTVAKKDATNDETVLRAASTATKSKEEASTAAAASTGRNRSRSVPAVVSRYEHSRVG
jgi:hypothetical protein